MVLLEEDSFNISEIFKHIVFNFKRKTLKEILLPPLGVRNWFRSWFRRATRGLSGTRS
jgi:hypothetical protein